MMYKVTIDEINQLRKKTGYGVMVCKRALISAKGDLDKSIEILIKKGEKRSLAIDNSFLTEGVVLAKTNNSKNIGSIIKLNCETDFVSKNKSFIKFAYELLEKAIYVESIEELLASNIEKNISVAQKLIEKSGILGEKITLSSFKKIQAPFLSFYVHNNHKIASLVGFSYFKNINIENIGKDIAMQVAAMNPIALDEKNISDDLLKKEINFLKYKIHYKKEEIKPKLILDKIIKGKLKNLFNEKTLMNQSFLKNHNISVGEYLKSYDSNLKILYFKRIAI